MKRDAYNVAIIGATGAVGVEMIRILEERQFPVGELRLLASARSAGREMEFRGERLAVQTLGSDSFDGIHIALFSAGSSVSREFAPIAAGAGAVVIDNSSAFRMEPDVPLVVPEINSHAIGDFRKRGIIANPNCTTAIALMVLKPIHDAAKLRRVV
ncbi:MAG: aspartate-semialdehyde dehydrogenase, partial [Candidatus Caldarchaeum sp.]